uniref:chemerin-like receptor 1 n=1 Tax=Pristiophorus japonicus TaxID=55135 RepID=UPI00398EFFE7
MEPEDGQLTNSSEVLHGILENLDYYTSIWWVMSVYSMVIYGVTCVLGVLGNGLVIWAIGFKLKRTANTVWLLSLAVADFTFTLLLPLGIAYIALDLEWHFGWLLCMLYFGVEVICLDASVLTLAAISVDRCVSVVLPIWSQKHRGPRPAALLSLGVWVAATIGSTPAFVFQQFESQGNWSQCSSEYLLEGEWIAVFEAVYKSNNSLAVIERAMSLIYIRDRALTFTRFLLGFIIPVLIIAVSYTIIGLRLRWGRLVPSGGKPFRVMAAIILAFLLCWAPYNICSILRLHTHEEPWPLLLIVGIPLGYSLAFFNSCINPVLYIFMWQDFRDIFKKSLQRANNRGAYI